MSNPRYIKLKLREDVKVGEVISFDNLCTFEYEKMSHLHYLRLKYDKLIFKSLESLSKGQELFFKNEFIYAQPEHLSVCYGPKVMYRAYWSLKGDPLDCASKEYVDSLTMPWAIKNNAVHKMTPIKESDIKVSSHHTIAMVGDNIGIPGVKKGDLVALKESCKEIENKLFVESESEYNEFYDKCEREIDNMEAKFDIMIAKTIEAGHLITMDKLDEYFLLFQDFTKAHLHLALDGKDLIAIRDIPMGIALTHVTYSDEFVNPLNGETYIAPSEVMDVGEDEEEDDYSNMSINEYCEAAFSNSLEKGFYDKDDSGDIVDRNFGEFISLVHSELSEALEHQRKGREDVWIGEYGENIMDAGSSNWYFDQMMLESSLKNLKPDGTLIELADAVIRIFDYCGSRNWNLESAIKLKMAYNATRPFKHGKKF